MELLDESLVDAGLACLVLPLFVGVWNGCWLGVCQGCVGMLLGPEATHVVCVSLVPGPDRVYTVCMVVWVGGSGWLGCLVGV